MTRFLLCCVGQIALLTFYFVYLKLQFGVELHLFKETKTFFVFITVLFILIKGYNFLDTRRRQ